MENRRTRRFKLQLPVSITRTGAERVTFAGLTANISSSGVLFTSEREPDLGGPIEYIITLNHEGAPAVNLRCMGKVLRANRVEREKPDSNFQVAATLERYEFVRERGRPAAL
jgi:PilZ domain